jgi:hypothetical protein
LLCAIQGNPKHFHVIPQHAIRELGLYHLGALELPTLEPFYETPQSKNVSLPLVGGLQRPPMIVTLDAPRLRAEPCFAGIRFGEILLLIAGKEVFPQMHIRPFPQT